MLNPMRSEREAFRALLYVAAFFLAVAVIVVIVRAIT
jgi:hypothetical protein